MNPLFNSTFFDCSRISRRRVLCGLAVLPTLSLHAADETPSCVLASEQEEGPYYVDGAVMRRNITEGKPGVPLRLRIVLMDAKRCSPLSNAVIDIWHCDPSGIYSGFERQSAKQGIGPGPGRRSLMPPDGPGGGGDFAVPSPPDGPALRSGMPPPPPGGPGARGPRSLDASRFLRGLQITNSQGAAEFNTLYPGWYAGRAIHIHLKVHTGGDAQAETYTGGHISHTGQLFFPEDVTEKIAKLEPYAKRLDITRTTQERDGIFRSQHGASSIVKLEKEAGASTSASFVATAVLAVDPQLTPLPAGGQGRGPHGPPPRF